METYFDGYQLFVGKSVEVFFFLQEVWVGKNGVFPLEEESRALPPCLNNPGRQGQKQRKEAGQEAPWFGKRAAGRRGEVWTKPKGHLQALGT